MGTISLVALFLLLVKQDRQQECVRRYFYGGVGGLTSWVMSHEVFLDNDTPNDCWYTIWNTCILSTTALWLGRKKWCGFVWFHYIVKCRIIPCQPTWTHLCDSTCRVTAHSGTQKLNPGQKTPVPWPQPTSHLINGNTKTDVKHNCYPLFLFIKIFPLPSCFCKSLWCGRVCFWQPVRGNFSFQDWIFEQIPSWSRFSHLSFLFFYVLWQYRGTSLAPPCQITLSSW